MGILSAWDFGSFDAPQEQHPERVALAAYKLTNRKDRVDDLLRRVRGPNPRPWP